MIVYPFTAPLLPASEMGEGAARARCFVVSFLFMRLLFLIDRRSSALFLLLFVDRSPLACLRSYDRLRQV